MFSSLRVLLSVAPAVALAYGSKPVDPKLTGLRRRVFIIMRRTCSPHLFALFCVFRLIPGHSKSLSLSEAILWENEELSEFNGSHDEVLDLIFCRWVKGDEPAQNLKLRDLSDHAVISWFFKQRLRGRRLNPQSKSFYATIKWQNKLKLHVRT